MKCQIKILSQVNLEPGTKGSGLHRLKCYGTFDVNVPEPFCGRDYLTVLTSWFSTYAKVLEKDRTAVLRIVPQFTESSLGL